MTLVLDYGHPYKNQASIVSFVALMSQASFFINCEIDKLDKFSAPNSSLKLSITPFTAFSIAKYLENNRKYIFKSILEAKILIILSLIPLLDVSCEGLVKAKFLDIYHNKTYIVLTTSINSVKTTLL